MKLLKWAAVVLLVLVALFFLVGFLLPSKWEVTRTHTIEAPPEAIYPYVANYRKWDEWSHWTNETYPSLKYSYSGPDEGVGAVQSWTSDDVGNGAMRITKADPQTGIEFELNMDESPRPIISTIAFAKEGEGTKITWTGKGDLGGNPITKYFGLMMDSMLGGAYEESLTKLEWVVEGDNHAPGDGT